MKKTIKYLSACLILITSIGYTFTDISAVSGVSNVDEDYEKRIKYYEKLEKERDKQIENEEKKK